MQQTSDILAGISTGCQGFNQTAGSHSRYRPRKMSTRHKSYHQPWEAASLTKAAGAFMETSVSACPLAGKAISYCFLLMALNSKLSWIQTNFILFFNSLISEQKYRPFLTAFLQVLQEIEKSCISSLGT